MESDCSLNLNEELFTGFSPEIPRGEEVLKINCGQKTNALHLRLANVRACLQNLKRRRGGDSSGGRPRLP